MRNSLIILAAIILLSSLVWYSYTHERYELFQGSYPYLVTSKELTVHRQSTVNTVLKIDKRTGKTWYLSRNVWKAESGMIDITNWNEID